MGEKCVSTVRLIKRAREEGSSGAVSIDPDADERLA
jgi:hypothetical protein